MQQSVSVPFGGSATLLNQGLQAGAIVYNTDTKNTVWVSANPACAPGNGIPLAPLASVTWSVTGPIYACCDSGVSSNVGLILSTDAVQYSNPEAVATATAAQLLAQGIPSVLTGSLISGIVNNAPFDVSGYASIAGVMNVPGPCSVSILFWDETDTIPLYERQFTFVKAVTNFQFSSGVYGPRCSITVTGGGPATNIAVYGSNRTLPDKCYTTGPFYVSVNESWPSGTVALGSALFTNGGEAYVNVRCTSDPHTTGFLLGFQYWDLSQSAPGSLETLYVATSSELTADTSGNYNIEKTFTVPAGYIQPSVLTFGAFSGVITINGTLP